MSQEVIKKKKIIYSGFFLDEMYESTATVSYVFDDDIIVYSHYSS